MRIKWQTWLGSTTCVLPLVIQSDHEYAVLSSGRILQDLAALPNALLTEEFATMIARLDVAAQQSGGLHSCLSEAQCITITKELQEASAKGVAILKGDTCTDQCLQEEVAAVYRILEAALRQCMKQGIGKWLFDYIWEEDGQEGIGLMAYMYHSTERPDIFRKTIALSIRGISAAATQALEGRGGTELLHQSACCT